MTIHQILSKASSIKKLEDRAKFLVNNDSLTLRDILNGNFNDRIKWSLPSGKPPYTPSEESSDGLHPSSIFKAAVNLKYLVVHPSNKNILQAKKEKMFIDMLETIDPEDAEVLILMKDKALQTKYKNITLKIVQMAFPSLINS